jgi:5-methylcytosine-specific restriction protein A
MKFWKPPHERRASSPHGKRPSYGGTWSRLSRTIRENNPHCQECRSAPSTEVHHIVPVAADARFKLDPRMLRAVCRPCHERLEALVARNRTPPGTPGGG